MFEDSQEEYQIFNVTESLTVTMTEVNSFTEIRVEPEEKANKAVTEYSFTVEGNVNAQNEDVLEISFPTQVSVASTTQCLGDSFNLSPQLQCDVDTTQNKLRIVLALINWRVLYTGLQKFVFKITDVTNSGSMAPTDTFSFLLISKDGT